MQNTILTTFCVLCCGVRYTGVVGDSLHVSFTVQLLNIAPPLSTLCASTCRGTDGFVLSWLALFTEQSQSVLYQASFLLQAEYYSWCSWTTVGSSLHLSVEAWI